MQLSALSLAITAALPDADANFPSPTLFKDFASDKELGADITFTRASTATYFDASGVLQSASNNVARFDHDPSTLVSKGLLIEESRVNSIRNNTMVGAAAGTPGTLPTNWSVFTSLTGLTREIVGFGTESGISYVDFRLSGTPSGAGAYNLFFDTITVTAAAQNQSWTLSHFVNVVGGSTAGISSVQSVIIEYNGASGFLTQGTSSFVPAAAGLMNSRVTYTRTLTNASTAYARAAYQYNLTGVAIDITLRIGLPQLEQGAFATSVIPTSGSALTRAADVASMTGTNFSDWFNATEGTIVCKADTTFSGTTFPNQFVFSDGTGSNLIYGNSRSSTTTTRMEAVAGGVTQVAGINSTVAAATGVSITTARAYKLNEYALSCNGETPQTDTTATVPTVTQLTLGAYYTGASPINGHIARLTYYPKRLSNTVLQGLSL